MDSEEKILATHSQTKTILLPGDKPKIKKNLSHELCEKNPELLEVFAGRLASVVHPNLVSIEDVGWDGELIYWTRDYIDGKPFLETAAPQTLPQILTHYHQMLQALEQLHKNQQWHLHLKPENIFLLNNPKKLGMLQITDFGFWDFALHPLDQENFLNENRDYLPPRFSEGAIPDFSWDLFSFGKLLLQTLSPQFHLTPQVLSQTKASDLFKLLPSSAAKNIPTLSHFLERLLNSASKDKFTSTLEAVEEFEKFLPEKNRKPKADSPIDVASEKIFRQILIQSQSCIVEHPNPKLGIESLQNFLTQNRQSNLAFQDQEWELIPRLPFGSERQFLIVEDAPGQATEAWVSYQDAPTTIVFGEKKSLLGKFPDWQRLKIPFKSTSAHSETTTDWMAALRLTAVPLREQDLTELLDLNPGALQEPLKAASSQGFCHRTLHDNREYFQARQSSVAHFKFSEEQAKKIIDFLISHHWYAAALQVLENFISNKILRNNPETILQKSRALEKIGKTREVFELLTAEWVQGLAKPEAAEAYAVLGRAWSATEQFASAEAAFKKSFATFRENQNRLAQIGVLTAYGDLLTRQHAYSKAMKYYDQALLFSKQENNSSLLGKVHVQVANLYLSALDFEAAEDQLNLALDLLQGTRDTLQQIELYLALGTHHYQKNNWDYAKSYLVAAFKLAVFQRLERQRGQCHQKLARLAIAQKNDSLGMLHQEAAIAALTSIDDKKSLCEVLLENADVAESQRQLERAENRAQKALKLALFHQNPGARGKAEWILGRLLRRDSIQFPEAMKRFEQAVLSLTQAKDFGTLAECRIEMAEIAKETGDLESTQRHFQEALHDIQESLQSMSPGFRELFLSQGKIERIQDELRKLQPRIKR